VSLGAAVGWEITSALYLQHAAVGPPRRNCDRVNRESKVFERLGLITVYAL